MRELTKTLMSYGWTAGMRPLEHACSAVGAGEAAAALKSLHAAGETLQRGLVDLVFGILGLDASGPVSAPGRPR